MTILLTSVIAISELGKRGNNDLKSPDASATCDRDLYHNQATCKGNSVTIRKARNRKMAAAVHLNRRSDDLAYYVKRVDVGVVGWNAEVIGVGGSYGLFIFYLLFSHNMNSQSVIKL